MCGIYSIYDMNGRKIHRNQLTDGLDQIKHRGPDDSGIYIENNIGLGSRRLSIIDLKGGHQPLSNEDNSIWITYNGEIYNYLDLRDTLIKKGHEFKTKTDTEVIIHLYEESGEDCVRELNGMFAFVIWDRNLNKLIAARDRIGIKPLFYSTHNNILRIGSEIKAFFSDKNFPRTINENALIDYFSFYYICAPNTIYSEIKRLSPGHILIFKDKKLRIEKYWDYNFEIDKDLNKDDLIKHIPQVLRNSVKRHLQSEVPLGLSLSGGLDSTSILAMVSELVSNIKSYTIGYEGQESYNEIKEAKKVANICGAEHNSYILSPKQIPELLPQVIKYLDEPNGDWSILAFYYLSKISKNSLTVVLNGAGGDELFGGYPTLIAYKIAKVYKKIPRFLRKNMISKFIEHLPSNYSYLSFDQKAKLFIKGSSLDAERAHHRYKEIFDTQERNSMLFADKFKNKFNVEHDPFDIFDQYLGNYNEKDMLNRLMYMDLKVFHPDLTLYASDITAMANSQEVRLPFLDLEMLNLSRKIPSDLKCHGFTTKYIFRKAMKSYLTKDILKMKKK